MKKTIIILLVFLASCSNSEKDEHSNTSTFDNTTAPYWQGDFYANYNNSLVRFEEKEHGDKNYLVQEIEQQKEDVVFRAKKIPTALYLLKENENYTDSELDSVISELKTEQIFYFEIEEEMRQDIMKKYHDENYDNAVQYISFSIQNDFKLCTASGDTLIPNFSIYERNFHLAPYERLIIDFTGLRTGEAFQLIYSDKMFGKGDMIFNFPDEKFVQNNVKNIL